MRENRKRSPGSCCTLRCLLPTLVLLSLLTLYQLFEHVLRKSSDSHDTAVLTMDTKPIPGQSKPIGGSPSPVLPQAAMRKRIAFAITITKDGPFDDGAAVLAYSIIKTSQGKNYDVSLVAFVHPDVVTSRPTLKRLGYHVIECSTPINTTAIKFKFLREKINKNGCCGAAELIKLNSYRLLQYDRVVHVDADTLFLQSVEELFVRNYSLIYTTDPNMASYKKKKEQFPVQGGFIGNFKKYSSFI